MKSRTRQLLSDVLAFLHQQNKTDDELDLMKANIATHLENEKNSFEITSVSRNDLDGVGFDSALITDAQIEHLADKMANDYCEQLFWTSLKIIADCHELPTKYDELTEDEFWEQYKPVQNHLVGDCSFDGCMFETYGEEVQYVLSKIDEQIVWTILDGSEDDNLYIVSGYHLVNRLGYLITEKPYTKEIEIKI